MAAPYTPVGAFQDASAFLAGSDASASAAKQLAALDAANNARKASQVGGISSGYVGPLHGGFRPSSLPATSAAPTHPPAFLHAQMNPHPPAGPAPHPHPNAQAIKARQLAFLNNLSAIWNARNTPLPPSITGIPSAYDPATSRWKDLQPTSEIGGVRLADRDVDLFRLWTAVLQIGGYVKVSQQNNWGNILPFFGLPDRLPQPQPNGNTSTAHALAVLYGDVLAGFEEVYVKNVTQQRKAMIARQMSNGQTPQGMGGFPVQQGQVAGPSGLSNLAPGTPQTSGVPASGSLAQYSSPVAPQTPQQFRANSVGLMGQGQSMSSMSPASPALHTGPQNPGYMDAQAAPATPSFAQSEQEKEMEARKRKSSELEDISGQRSRRKTEFDTPTASTSAETTSTVPPRKQPSRRKIEYVPVAREIDTAGGRDVQRLRAEISRSQGPMRDINDWGVVNIDTLILSLRSRLTLELSYALTTLTVLSVMHAREPNSGFTIHLCPELMDELLDVLRENAFPGAEDTEVSEEQYSQHVVTHRELIGFITEDGASLSDGLKLRPGKFDISKGLTSRPGDIIRVIMNILRNLSAVDANQTYLAQNSEMIDLILRVISLAPSGSLPPEAASPVMSLPDLVAVRKDMLHLFCNLGNKIQLSSGSEPPSKAEGRRARGIYEFVTCYLVDPREALSPTQLVIQSGAPLNPSVRPPAQADIALEVFTRISQADTNRQVFRLSTSNDRMWILFKALVHRLPLVDVDFQVALHDSWMSYILKIVISLYSLAFLMPPDMKKKVRTDRNLGFAKIMLRLIKKFTVQCSNEYRGFLNVCARRATEAIKIVDDRGDPFASASSNGPVLSFGVGYGEATDKQIEKGTGMLGGYQDDVTWGIMQTELDEVMFSELESLARVQCN